MDNAVVVAGVLSKYANLAKGWRDRLFVLHDGKLSYYKVRGPARCNVHLLLKSFSTKGRREIRIIGAETALIQRRDEESQNRGASEQNNKPAAEYDVTGIKLRESSSESHKFYVHGHGISLFLKCETPDDRGAWMRALSTEKRFVSHSTFEYVSEGDSEPLLQSQMTNASDSKTAKLKTQRLMNDLSSTHGLQPQGCKLVEGEFDALQQEIVSLMQQNIALRTSMSQLQEDRRVLETRLVADVAQTNPRHEASASSSREDDSRDEDDDNFSQFYGANADYDSEDDSTAFSHRDPDGDEFYEARENGALYTSSRRHSTSDIIPGKGGRSKGSLRLAQNSATSAAARTPSMKCPVNIDSTAQGDAGACIAEDATIAPAELDANPPAWTKDLVAAPTRRTHMPVPQEEEKSASLWSIIKESIGKDLSRVCLPVFFNEPLSALQKMTEEAEYSELLDSAARAPRGSFQRIMWVGAFAVTGYSATNGRTCKPFNPLLGETYEYEDAKSGIRFIAEKVIHHPTVLAAHAAGRGWALDADIEGKSKFWGRCIQLNPVGFLQVTFHDGEVVHWNKVTTTINNLIMGKIYVDHGGIMRIESTASQYDMKIKFTASSAFSRGKHQVSGVVSQGGVEMAKYTLEGTWDGELTADMGSGPQQIWVAKPPPPDPTRYNLTQFAITLNELTAGLTEKLAPTDCRLRPDQAFLEQGRYDEANFEKQRLEKKQRQARKEAEEGVPIHPRWFEPIEGAQRGQALAYRYVGGYWESRDKGDYKDCRDIFGN